VFGVEDVGGSVAFALLLMLRNLYRILSVFSSNSWILRITIEGLHLANCSESDDAIDQYRISVILFSPSCIILVAPIFSVVAVLADEVQITTM